MKKLFLVAAISISQTGCLSNRAFNTLGNVGDIMQRQGERMHERELMEQQHQYQMQEIQASQQQSQMAKVAVYSDPPSANITETKTGVSLGVSPVFSKYFASDLAKHFDPSGCYLVNGLTATWSTGESASTDTILKLCNGINGDYAITLTKSKSTLPRPPSSPKHEERSKPGSYCIQLSDGEHCY